MAMALPAPATRPMTSGCPDGTRFPARQPEATGDGVGAGGRGVATGVGSGVGGGQGAGVGSTDGGWLTDGEADEGAPLAEGEDAGQTVALGASVGLGSGEAEDWQAARTRAMTRIGSAGRRLPAGIGLEAGTLVGVVLEAAHGGQ
jgi:hypothetical protein